MGFGWHTCRRMHLTLVQEEGATTFEAIAQAGHSRPSMTGQYILVGLESREQAVARLQRRLLGRHGTRVETDVRDNARNCSAKKRPSV